MFKSTKNSFLIATLLCVGAFGLNACDKAATNTANTTTNKNTAVVANSNNAAKTDTADHPTNSGNSTKTETASTGEKIGVAECDEYIEKYEACLSSIGEKYPQVQPQLKSAFETQREAFKKAAANPQSKASLASGCKQAIDTAKQATSAYACKW